MPDSPLEATGPASSTGNRCRQASRRVTDPGASPSRRRCASGHPGPGRASILATNPRRSRRGRRRCQTSPEARRGASRRFPARRRPPAWPKAPIVHGEKQRLPAVLGQSRLGQPGGVRSVGPPARQRPGGRVRYVEEAVSLLMIDSGLDEGSRRARACRAPPPGGGKPHLRPLAPPGAGRAAQRATVQRRSPSSDAWPYHLAHVRPGEKTLPFFSPDSPLSLVCRLIWALPAGATAATLERATSRP